MTSKKADIQTLTIQPPEFQVLTVGIRNDPTSPYVQNAFSAKARAKMEATQRAGSTSKKNTAREARDFEADYEAAMHRSLDGWHGIPAPAFRNALISACRTAGFTMTRAKLSVFIEADGTDASDGGPLVKIASGEPEVHQGAVRNASGVTDLRWRPMWRQWSALLRVRYDSGQFTPEDLLNLIIRAGSQVGIGEGRPDSRSSNGLGWGMFVLDDSVAMTVETHQTTTAADLLAQAKDAA